MLTLWLIDTGVRGSVRLPAAWFDAAFRAPWLGNLALALLLISLGLGYTQRWARWNRGYWLPFAVVALALLTSVKFGAAAPPP